MWNLWLDDERPCPHEEAAWVIARTSEEAKALVVSHGPPEEMSLDHDLGGEDTAMIFVRWLADNHFTTQPVWRVHSQNPVGKANLESFLHSWTRAAV